MKNDEIIIQFFQNYKIAIKQLFTAYIKKSSEEEFLNQLKDHLCELNICNTENIYNDLFYEANNFAKSKYNPVIKKYICPGCKFLGKKTILQGDFTLKCKECQEKMSFCQDKKLINLYSVFSNHVKSGYKCNLCKRFLPSIRSSHITCPYLDCSFFGPIQGLKRMNHPVSSDIDIVVADTKSIIENNNYLKIESIISSQLNQLLFGNISFTVQNKACVYKAFKKLLEMYPEKMIDYLMNNSRSGGFQHKVFQEYISLLEELFPIMIRKNKKFVRISDLLDNNLCLFDGISTFTTHIDKNVIHNHTQEYYIGGRKAAYTKPYYIGKLLNIVDKDTGQSLMNNVKEYSFNKIVLTESMPPNLVEVSHLRIPPHYQMKGMVHVNRIRKLIVDEIKS